MPERYFLYNSLMGEAVGGGFDKVLLYHDRESFRVNATNLINLERPPFGSL
jgi:hypothetical protein